MQTYFCLYGLFIGSAICAQLEFSITSDYIERLGSGSLWLYFFSPFLHFETDRVSKQSEALFQKGPGRPSVEKLVNVLLSEDIDSCSSVLASLEWIFTCIMNFAKYFLKCFEVFEFESNISGQQ